MSDRKAGHERGSTDVTSGKFVSLASRPGRCLRIVGRDGGTSIGRFAPGWSEARHVLLCRGSIVSLRRREGMPNRLAVADWFASTSAALARSVRRRLRRGRMALDVRIERLFRRGAPFRTPRPAQPFSETS